MECKRVMRMKRSERDQFIIDQYKNDEKMMVLIFTQWCVNHGLDPYVVYEEAYPHERKNNAITEALEQTVSKKESEEISVEIVQHVLQLFGNDDLAFVVQQYADAKSK